MKFLYKVNGSLTKVRFILGGKHRMGRCFAIGNESEGELIATAILDAFEQHHGWSGRKQARKSEQVGWLDLASFWRVLSSLATAVDLEDESGGAWDERRRLVREIGLSGRLHIGVRGARGLLPPHLFAIVTASIPSYAVLVEDPTVVEWVR